MDIRPSQRISKLLIEFTNKRVFLAGGLGNQLFQYAFAHFLTKFISNRPSLINLNTRGGLPHTKQILEIGWFGCSHCLQTRNLGSESLNSFINPWLDRALLTFVWGRTLNLKSNPFIYFDQTNSLENYSNFVGYFQNKDYILASEHLFMTEIRQFISESMPSIQYLPTEFEVIHIRQGDTKTAENIERVGVLSTSYYQSILTKQSELFRLVVTDDLRGAQETLANSKIDMWLGPNDLTAREALALMSGANRLITANSTLSWWSGFIAVKDEREVIVPTPFFKSKELQAGAAFHYPDFKLQESKFI